MQNKFLLDLIWLFLKTGLIFESFFRLAELLISLLWMQIWTVVCACFELNITDSEKWKSFAAKLPILDFADISKSQFVSTSSDTKRALLLRYNTSLSVKFFDGELLVIFYFRSEITDHFWSLLRPNPSQSS